MYTLLYQNLLETANPKTTIDKHIKSKTQLKTTLKMVVKPQENEKGWGEKTPTKTNPKQLRKWQQEHMH